MTGVNLGMRRVVFELPGRDLPELMAVLGDFAIAHNFAIDFDEVPPGATEPSLTLERGPQYNPDLVLWMTDKSAGREVAVITKSHLTAFAQTKYGNTQRGERLANVLFRPQNVERHLSPFMHMSPDGSTALGLRADHARTVSEQLSSKRIELTNLGQRSVGLLAEYCAELFPDMPGEESEEQAYDQDLVKWVDDPETKARVAVITEGLFEKFGRASRYSPGFPTRIIHTLGRAQTSYAGSQTTEGYLHGERRELVAGKLPELVGRLADGELRLATIGPHSIKLLGEYAHALFQVAQAETQ